MANFGLTDTGLTLPRQADLLAIIKARYAELTGEDPDWERDEVLGTLLTLSTFQMDQISEITQSVYDAWDENNATGVQLENIGGLFPGISRKVAEPSLVNLVLGGDPGTVIPSGSVVEFGGVDGRARWATQATVEITVFGEVQVEARNVVTGPIQAETETDITVIKIITPVAGWAFVVALERAVPGSDKETDDQYRKRRRESLQIVGGRSLGAILGNVLALPFITDATVIENTDAIPQTVEGVVLPPHSFSVVVQPDGLTDSQSETLAQTLYNIAPVGIEIVGTVTATVTGADGLEKDVAWDHPAELLWTVQWLIRPEPGFAFSAMEVEIINLTQAYSDALGVGEPVRILDLLTRANTEISGLQQATLTLDGFAVDIEPGALEVAVVNPVGSSVGPL